VKPFFLLVIRRTFIFGGALAAFFPPFVVHVKIGRSLSSGPPLENVRGGRGFPPSSARQPPVACAQGDHPFFSPFLGIKAAEASLLIVDGVKLISSTRTPLRIVFVSRMALSEGAPRLCLLPSVYAFPSPVGKESFPCILPPSDEGRHKRWSLPLRAAELLAPPPPQGRQKPCLPALYPAVLLAKRVTPSAGAIQFLH